MVLGADAALRLEDLEFISKDIWLQVSLEWVYGSHVSNCQHTYLSQCDWFVKCAFKFSFFFKFKWHVFTVLFAAQNLVWLTLWKNNKTLGVKVMALFHQCNLGQNFALGYKTINHISRSSRKLLGNPDWLVIYPLAWPCFCSLTPWTRRASRLKQQCRTGRFYNSSINRPLANMFVLVKRAFKPFFSP